MPDSRPRPMRTHTGWWLQATETTQRADLFSPLLMRGCHTGKAGRSRARTDTPTKIWEILLPCGGRING